MANMLLFSISRHPQHSQQAGLTAEQMIIGMKPSIIGLGLMSDFPTCIIELLRGCPHGLTSKEIAKLLGTSPVNLSSRLSKLAAYGIIGQVRGTRAAHGTTATIYRAPIQPPAGA